MMTENYLVSAKETAKQFNMDHSKVINTVSYIFSKVEEINYETQIIPHQLNSKGEEFIDSQLYVRIGNRARERMDGAGKRHL